MLLKSVFLAFAVASAVISDPELKLTPIKDNDIFLNERFDTGYLSMEPRGDMFFWHFPSRSKPDVDPLVLWISGSPGCTSESSLLDEIGPFWIQSDATLKRNDNSWTNIANMVFLDQPLGLGYSEAKFNFKVSGEGIAKDIHLFMKLFFRRFPKYKQRPLYIMGSSYGAHFIPLIADYFLVNPLDGFNLAGISIGNGWVDPLKQYPSYPDYAKEEHLISSTEYDIYKQGFLGCANAINSMLWPIAVATCNVMLNSITKGKNIYNVRNECVNPPHCIDNLPKERFLNRPDVKKILGVDKDWKTCDVWIQGLLIGDYRKSTKGYVEKLLQKNIKVLVYNGDKDFICNWKGAQAWTDSLKSSVWNKATDFSRKELKKYTEIGFAKTIAPLTFVRVADAGHMVSKDRSKEGLELFSDFINNRFEEKLKSEPEDEAEGQIIA